MTSSVLLRSDASVCYPVSEDGVPILLSPEALYRDASKPQVDLSTPRFAEAYEEMNFYNDVASGEIDDIASGDAYRSTEGAVRAAANGIPFGGAHSQWLDAKYDSTSQAAAFEFLAPLIGDGRVLQLGGKGIQAAKFLLAGASEAWVASPMESELVCARALAEHAGTPLSMNVVAAIGEELPFPDGAFDAVYIGNSLHHMVVDDALGEIARILRPGGRFAAVEPWKAAFYTIGTRILGKQERGVHCRPLDAERLTHTRLSAFASARVERHGAISRYALIAAGKARIRPSVDSVHRIARRAEQLLPGGVQDRLGSSAAILCER